MQMLKLRHTLYVLLTGGVLLHSPLLLAQVPVVDANQPREVTTGPLGPAPANQGEMMYQLQQLQQEVMELRGALEEQAYTIRKLQQQRLDDYRNIDRRLTESNTTSSAGMAPVTGIAPAVGNDVVAVVTQVNEVDEKAAYQAAYEYIKTQQFDQAITAFGDFVVQYPQGNYAGNAWYWLGELHLLKGELEPAKLAFLQVLENFPGHRKSADATFKLAQVYHRLGDAAQAKAMAEAVITQYSQTSATTAQLARDFLSENYP
ncbi:MAG: tol-pal system protein YbgF [Pseudomonadales bacterium]